MTTEFSQLPATPERVRRLAQLGYLDRQGLEQGLRLTGGIPNRQGWARFLDYSLLVLGALFFTSGLFFFVAYNWEELPRFARFGVLQTAIVLLLIITHWVGLNRLGGKIALTVASLLVGALLAVFGQEYQTGADAYTLFGYWALLIAGWVVISKFDLLWGILLALLNVALVLFWTQVLPGDQYPQPESLFALNAVALIAWEMMGRRFAWWQHRWLNRLTALVAFVFALWPMLATILSLFDSYTELPTARYLGALLYLIFVAAVLVVYSRWQPDLLMLTMAMFSLIIVLTTLIGRSMVELDDEIGYFITAFTVILQAGVAVTILRRIAQRWEATV